MESYSFTYFAVEHDSRQSGGVHPYDMSCQAERVSQDGDFHTRQPSTVEDFIV